MTRRLTNQDAFDGAMLHLLNQGHSCLSASGQARYRGPRGKSAVGALIPDELYVNTMEGKKLQHWLAARGTEYDALRERFGSVTPSLLSDLQDLHDRSGSCMPSLYRHLVLAGAQRIAQSFKLSMRLVTRSATYQHLRGPRIFSGNGVRRIPAAAPAIAVSAVPELAVAPAIQMPPAHEQAAAPTIRVPPAPELAVAPATDVSPASELAAASAADVSRPSALAVAPAADASPASALAVTPITNVPPASEPAATPGIDLPPAPAAAPHVQLTAHPQEELDLIARGIAKAIAAASASSLDQRSGRR